MQHARRRNWLCEIGKFGTPFKPDEPPMPGSVAENLLQNAISKARQHAGVQIEVNSPVVGWDDHTDFAQRIRNYTKKPIEVEIRRTFPGHVVFRSGLAAKSHDYQTIQYVATVKPGQKADLLYEVLQHQGRNAKQANVTVEGVEMKP